MEERDTAQQLTLETAIAYIVDFASKHKEQGNLGKTKLFKILWFAERAYMAQHYARLIEGFEYRHMPFGPVPNPEKIDRILDSLIQSGCIAKKGNNFVVGAKPLESYPPNVHFFDEEILHDLPKTARELSGASHDALWDCTENGEVMPVECVFWNEPPLDEAQKARAIENAKRVLQRKGLL